MTYRQIIKSLLVPPKWVLNCTQRPPAILYYHRVIRLDCDPQLLCVAPARFEEQLALLRKEFVPLSLGQLLERAAQRSMPRRAVVVTFDDGYADNLEWAQPLLEKHQVPATFFISSGQINSKEEFWWDELEAILLAPIALPAELALDLGGENFRWSLGSAAEYSRGDWERNCSWAITRGDSPTPRHALYRALCSRLWAAQPEQRLAILRALRSWAGTNGAARATHRAMTTAELARLASSPLCEIGAHTVGHPSLAELSEEEQRQEIVRSKQELEAIIGRPVRTFSYPYGTLDSFTHTTAELVRSAGFIASCTTVPGWVRRRTDLFRLPRFVVRDWSAPEFRRQLLRWFCY